MTQQMKQRLIGGLVLLAIVAIFLPMLFHHSQPSTSVATNGKIPTPPQSPQMHLNMSMPQAAQNIGSNSGAMAVSATVSAPQMVTTPQQPPQPALGTPPKAWVIQLGTFSNHANAERLIKRLRTKGFDAYLRQTTNKSGSSLSRVFVGPEVRLDRAKQLKQELHLKFELKGIIKRYQI